ncbi:MAG: ATP-binding protein [Labilithrix sp.]|nr:ATP-binding protein [Labilithrix sp.]MCW5816763.1 ATP-binding protein [Labilithrix sp.]
MGAEEPTRVSDAELRAEMERLIEERYVASLAPQRSWGFFAGVVAFAVLLAGLTFVPIVRRFLGVGPALMVPALAGPVVAIAVATVAARARGGITGRAHKTAERVETACTAAFAAALVVASGSATSIFWLISIMHVVTYSQELQHARFTQLAHGACLGAAAIAFGANGHVADAAGIAFFTLLLLFFARAQEASARKALELTAERNVMRARYEGLLVDRERRRIARDLHDGLGAQLASIAWSADAIAGTEADRDALAELSRRARSTLGELREVVHGLKAADMRVGELAASIEETCRALATSCELAVASDGDAVVRADQCLEVTLIVREAVRNAAQHASAKRIGVRLFVDAGALVVRVEDDGRGLSPDRIAESRGGLSHLKQRAELLAGALTFEAPPAGGTAVVVRAPLRA